MFPQTIFDALFQMPPIPPPPTFGGGFGIMSTAAAAIAAVIRWAYQGFAFAFKVGVEQGFLAGCVFTLIVTSALRKEK